MSWLTLPLEGFRHLVARSTAEAATNTVQKRLLRVVQAAEEPLLTFDSCDSCQTHPGLSLGNSCDSFLPRSCAPPSLNVV